MINGELLFREHFVNFLDKSLETGTPNYSSCSWNSIEDYLRDMMSSPELIKVNIGEHWSKSNLAWFSPYMPYTINLNVNKMYRTDQSIAGSIAHEFVHLVDFHVKHESFGHPSMRFWRKTKVLNSAPYIVGKEFKTFLDSFQLVWLMQKLKNLDR